MIINGIERKIEPNANLHGANLSGADLRGADLRGADLHGATLSGADLRWADLRWANLRWANLHWANLHWADLRGADLRGADLRGADLSGAIWNYTTIGIDLACPEVGGFTAYKISHGKVITLEIPADALRSSATTAKCRVSKALVIAIDGGLQEIVSDYDAYFIYRVGETVEVADFDTDRWNECSKGIHCFINRHSAETWEG